MKRILLIAAMTIVSLSAAAQNITFGFVDYTELVQLMPEMDSARVQIEAASAEAQETYQAMMEEYQTKAQQFQQKQASWTPAIRESKAAELQQIEYRIQEFQQAIQQELQQTQQTLQAPIYDKAQKVVTDLAKGKGLSFVFEKSSMLYIDSAQGVDLTPEARKALNIAEGRTLESLQQELQAKAQAAQAAQGK